MEAEGSDVGAGPDGAPSIFSAYRARRILHNHDSAGIAELATRLTGAMIPEQLAEGIIEIANWSQANAIRQMTIQRGIDPRAFALLSFGGAGPAQSPAVMELLGMKACIVPLDPGNLSAFGLLAVDWRTDHIRTKVMHEDSADLDAIAGHYAQMEREAAAALARDGIAPQRIRVRGGREIYLIKCISRANQ